MADEPAPQVEKLDGVDECLLVFTDNVLMAANRLAMREFSLNADRFGHLTFQRFFRSCGKPLSALPLPLGRPDIETTITVYALP